MINRVTRGAIGSEVRLIEGKRYTEFVARLLARSLARLRTRVRIMHANLHNLSRAVAVSAFPDLYARERNSEPLKPLNGRRLAAAFSSSSSYRYNNDDDDDGGGDLVASFIALFA